jgi:hypothetical protein
MATHPSILLIEDGPGERELFRMALMQAAADLTRSILNPTSSKPGACWRTYPKPTHCHRSLF